MKSTTWWWAAPNWAGIDLDGDPASCLRAGSTRTGNPVTKAIKLTLTEDEAEMIVDALEADMEGYLESAKEARGNANREDVKTFTEAAERIGKLAEKIRALVE
jgi:hypothetical protein